MDVSPPAYFLLCASDSACPHDTTRDGTTMTRVTKWESKTQLAPATSDRKCREKEKLAAACNASK